MTIVVIHPKCLTNRHFIACASHSWKSAYRFDFYLTRASLSQILSPYGSMIDKMIRAYGSVLCHYIIWCDSFPFSLYMTVLIFVSSLCHQSLPFCGKIMYFSYKANIFLCIQCGLMPSLYGASQFIQMPCSISSSARSIWNIFLPLFLPWYCYHSFLNPLLAKI